VAAPLILVGCGSQSGGSAAGAGTTTAVGNAQNTVSETTAFANRTVPDINSMTLVASTLNLRAKESAGIETTLTVFVGDNLNDKTVLDGISINFAAEGGRVEESCAIESGSCSVTWNSQNPMPTDGRITIVAWMTGAESFKDLNANGLYDDGDLFADVASRPDLSEPYLNDNMITRIASGRPLYSGPGALNNIVINSVRDSTEVFFDTDGLTNGDFDDKDGKYSGPQCAHATLCSPLQSIFIWRELELVASDGAIKISVFDVSSGGLDGMTTASFPMNVSAGKTLRIEITDGYGNPLPADTKIKISADGVSAGEIDVAVGNTTLPQPIYFGLGSDGDSTADGTLTIEVDMPAAADSSQGALKTKDEYAVSD
jgi:hypothetical protein